ncbi:uncharacterized protein Tco025E_02973 [Trypanosoma conorhini]|uniref:Uncharacterized protein n=1 Tax=Trypanosoma conorhini TaxID=83891 RepID=A0A422PYX0_9TRYP|nr:uncharacterized protein Tco025E_02973 [Trypanosoma conorhini]RNF22908.1 hypothetical protein Tco025E_02973 [Trypanosoma conorhini]
MFFVLPSPVYPRRRQERVLKGLYQLCNTVDVVCFVVLMTEFYVRLESSLPGYFTHGNVTVGLGLWTATENCNYSAEIRMGRVFSTLSVDGGSLPVPLMVMAQYAIAILVMLFLAILNNAVSLINYSAGGRHLRICGVHVPFYHILCVFSFLYCFVLIVLVFVTQPVRGFYKEAVLACAAQLESSNPALLLASEYDDYNIFSTPVEWALAAALINLCIYCVGAAVLTWNSHSREIVLFSEAPVPWEGRGVRCKTNKPALRLHTTARDTILGEAHAALSRGEGVRIVCSYALMTEAEYETQVEEMRQRFSAEMKEEQFEQLRSHFGRASDLEENGFLWRRQAAPPRRRRRRRRTTRISSSSWTDSRRPPTTPSASATVTPSTRPSTTPTSGRSSGASTAPATTTSRTPTTAASWRKAPRSRGTRRSTGRAKGAAAAAAAAASTPRAVGCRSGTRRTRRRRRSSRRRGRQRAGRGA